MTEKNIGELGKKRLFKILLDKLNKGKTLTANERKQYDELAELFTEQQQVPEQTSANPLEFPRPIIAAFFSVTPQTITNWTDKGMPKKSRGLYDLKECFQWWHRVIDGGSSKEIDVHKNIYWREMALGKEIENQTSRGLLITKEDVIKEWTLRATELRTGLRSWASRLPPQLEGKNVIELRTELQNAVDDLLMAYCRTGRFTPDVAEPEKKKERKTNGRKREKK